MAHLLLPEQMKALKEIFDAVDKDGSGEISAAELSIIVNSFGKELDEFQIQDLIAEVDIGENGGDGYLDFHEFANMMTRPLQCVDPEQEIRQVYEQLDYNKDGKVSVSDLAKSLEAMGELMRPEEVKSMIDEVDADGSGYMDFEQLDLAMKS